MKKLLSDLKIDETLTKQVRKERQFSKLANNVPHKKHLNYMADLLILPKTSSKNIGLLVVVDLGTSNFDIEPITGKDVKTVLDAYKRMVKRKYIKDPYYSIQTDAGGEFKGDFNKYFFDKNIFHKTALPDRHKQQSAVENLNKELGRLLNGYMNTKEEETGEVFRDWDEIVSEVREKLNPIRQKKEENPRTQELKPIDPTLTPKFNVGDIVLVKSEVPMNMLGNKQPTKAFRMGDVRWNTAPKKIVQVFHDPDVGFRYYIETIPNASFTSNELKMTKEKEAKFEVRELIGKKTVKGQVYYLVWWKKYLKSQSTWEPKTQLVQDGLQTLINDYEKLFKTKEKEELRRLEREFDAKYGSSNTKKK
jgi:hypothetical protein